MLSESQWDILTDHGAENVTRTDRPASHMKMPPEILAKIFTHCLDSEIVELRAPGKRSLPWTLGYVCSRWRQVAMAEPLLWRRIDARNCLPLHQSTLWLIHEIFANRGGSAAIELQITPACRNDWTALLDLASTYPSRFCSLRLTVNGWYSPVCLRHSIRAFDHLETVALNFCRPSYVGGNEEEAVVISAFSTARSLRKVEIYRECAYNPMLLDMKSFPWAQLTSLNISCITTFAVSRILCECVELTDLAVGLQVGSSDPHDMLPTTIHLVHLHSITIHFGATSDVVLDRLITPALKRLSFGRWSLAPQRCIMDLIQRSDCDLESLHCPADDAFDIVSLLQATPHLQEFAISTTEPISDESLEAVRIKNLSPKLRTLTIPIRSIRSAVHFLQTRWAKSLCGKYEGIRTVKLRMTWADFSPDIEWFEALEHELMGSGRTIEIILT